MFGVESVNYDLISSRSCRGVRLSSMSIVFAVSAGRLFMKAHFHH